MSTTNRLIDSAAAVLREQLPADCGETRILLGVSGGADSMALLHVLTFGLSWQTAVCHLNHGLRGEESERDEAFVRQLCEQWGVPCTVHREDIAARAKEWRCCVEEAGRRARYLLFAQTAADRGIRLIATAHTRSDSLETMLLNLARGSGMRGLTGIPASRMLEGPAGPLQIVRPLLDCTRTEVEAYCDLHRIPFVTDSSNLSNEYSRNKIRHIVIPALQEINPAFADTASRTMRILREEDALLDELADDALWQAWRPDSDGWEVSRLRQLPVPLLRRAVLRLLTQQGRGHSSKRAEDLAACIMAGTAHLELGEGQEARIHRGILTLGSLSEPFPPFCMDIAPPAAEMQADRMDMGEYRIGETVYRALLLAGSPAQLPEKIQKNLLYLTLDYDTINRKLQLRSRLPGDRISVAGRGGEKKLKKLLNEAGLTEREKSAVPVLADEQGPAAVYGFGPAVRCAVRPETRRVLVFGRAEDLDAMLVSSYGNQDRMRRQLWNKTF